MLTQETKPKENKIKNKKDQDPNSEYRHSLFCGNCFSQWILSELGYYLDESDNKIAGYCPACFFNEFLDITNYQLREEQVKIFENGPENVYSRPKHVLKKSEHEDDFKGFRKSIQEEMAKRATVPKDIQNMDSEELQQEIEYMKRELKRRVE
jgi:hypothetical protein